MSFTTHKPRSYRALRLDFLCPVRYLRRVGLLYSTPLSATVVSLAARTITLGATVVLFGGIPDYAMAALAVFVGLGAMPTVTSLSSDDAP